LLLPVTSILRYILLSYKYTHNLIFYIIEKSGGVAEGHDVGFLLYFGERLQGVRRDIQNNNYNEFVGILKNPEEWSKATA